MNHLRLLKVGLTGLVILALCCFTPILVVVFGAIGLSAVLVWLDYILLPLLLIFVDVTIYAIVKLNSAPNTG